MVEGRNRRRQLQHKLKFGEGGVGKCGGGGNFSKSRNEEEEAIFPQRVNENPPQKRGINYASYTTLR